MFKTGDRVRYIGKRVHLKGAEMTVKNSTAARHYRGGGYCSFYEEPGLMVAWANLEGIFPISLENK